MKKRETYNPIKENSQNNTHIIAVVSRGFVRLKSVGVFLSRSDPSSSSIPTAGSSSSSLTKFSTVGYYNRWTKVPSSFFLYIVAMSRIDKARSYIDSLFLRRKNEAADKDTPLKRRGQSGLL